MDKVTTLLLHNAILLSGKDFFAYDFEGRIVVFSPYPWDYSEVPRSLPYKAADNRKGMGSLQG